MCSSHCLSSHSRRGQNTLTPTAWKVSAYKSSLKDRQRERSFTLWRRWKNVEKKVKRTFELESFFVHLSMKEVKHMLNGWFCVCFTYCAHRRCIKVVWCTECEWVIFWFDRFEIPLSRFLPDWWSVTVNKEEDKLYSTTGEKDKKSRKFVNHVFSFLTYPYLHSN